MYPVLAGAKRLDRDLFFSFYGELLEKRRPWAGWSIYCLTIFLVCFVVWAYKTSLDEITSGTGSVIPVSKEQILQSLEGGILASLLVKEGDFVEKGSLLLRIDATRAGAYYDETLAIIDSLKANLVRLRAEASGEEKLSFPKELSERRPKILLNEIKTFNARRRTLLHKISSQEKALSLAREELKIMEPLFKNGVVSEVDVLRLRRQIAEYNGSLYEIKNKFRSNAREEITKTEAELSMQEAILVGREDRVKQTELYAPVSGVITDIHVNTIGAIIKPGNDILSIIPTRDELLFEVKVKPSDIAFLHPGLKALIKITAYDFSIYGGIEGFVENISANTIKEAPNGVEESYYKVSVRSLSNKSLKHPNSGEFLPIIPGMTAQVDIITGKKSILDYILKPIMKAKYALREK